MCTTRRVLIEYEYMSNPANKTPAKYVFIDLDETLIHCNESVNVPSDVIVPIVFPTGEIIEVIH